MTAEFHLVGTAYQRASMHNTKGPETGTPELDALWVFISWGTSSVWKDKKVKTLWVFCVSDVRKKKLGGGQQHQDLENHSTLYHNDFGTNRTS